MKKRIILIPQSFRMSMLRIIKSHTKYLVLLLPLLVFAGCRDTGAEIFDKKVFWENQTDRNWQFVDESGYEIWQMASGTYYGSKLVTTSYLDYRNKPGDKLVQVSVYDSDGYLMSRDTSFTMGGFKIGISREFDRSGKVIAEYDCNEPFAFDLEQVFEFMRERSIDPDDECSFIYRFNHTPEPWWEIKWPYDSTANAWNRILVSGLDGRIMEQTVEYSEE